MSGFGGLGRELISSQPDPDGCELDTGVVVFRVLVVADRDSPEVLDLVEEALDETAVAVQEGAEGRDVLAVGRRPDVGPGALLGEPPMTRIAAGDPITEQDSDRRQARPACRRRPCRRELDLRSA